MREICLSKFGLKTEIKNNGRGEFQILLNIHQVGPNFRGPDERT